MAGGAERRTSYPFDDILKWPAAKSGPEDAPAPPSESAAGSQGHFGVSFFHERSRDSFRRVAAVCRCRGRLRHRTAGAGRTGPPAQPHQCAGLRADDGPQRGSGHRRVPACCATGPVRAVVERAVPRLWRRARRRRVAQDRQSGRIRVRVVRRRLRADARRNGRGHVHGDAAHAPDRRPFTGRPPAARVLPSDPLELGHRSARRRLREGGRRHRARTARPAARREGDAVADAPGRVRDRLRSGHPHGTIHRRQGRAHPRAPGTVGGVQPDTRPEPDNCDAPGPVALGRWTTAPTRGSCRACSSPGRRCTTCLASGVPFSPPSAC